MPDDPTPRRLLLNADLGPKAVAELKVAFGAHRGFALDLDAGEVAQIGGGCLQLLVSAQKTWAAEGLACRLIAPSAVLTDALSFTGLAGAFEIETGVAA